MGSFQITYDDFTGGHYMGNRATNQPSNTWTGTNTTLDPRGNLIAVDAILESTITTGLSPSGADQFTINGVFSTPIGVLVFYSFFDSGVGTTSYAYGPLLGTQTLGGAITGYMAADQTTDHVLIYYKVANSTDVRVFSFATSGIIAPSDDLVTSTAPVGTSLYKYKYRLLSLGETTLTIGVASYIVRNRLYYSDPTATTWSASDYYEFPGQITNVAPRTNDLIVTTTAGIFSVTGVLGESVNIQQIYTFDELSQGMANPVTYGRDFVYLNDYLDSMNGKIYAGLGVGKNLIGTIDLEALPPLNIGLTNPGMIVVMSNAGYSYAMDSEGRWTRFQFGSWDTTDEKFGTPISPGLAAISLSDLPGNMYLAVPALKPYQADTSDAVMRLARADGVNIKIYKATHTTKNPVSGATGSAILAEYWHQKPMVVREVTVEVEYVGTGANAAVSVNIIPIGAIDINSTVAPTMTSSTITAPTESTAGSTIIHRFFVNNAGRAYGFKPNISHKGVRVKRVICVCED